MVSGKRHTLCRRRSLSGGRTADISRSSYDGRAAQVCISYSHNTVEQERVLDFGDRLRADGIRIPASLFGDCLAINTLFARKAAQYNGRNGVKIIFTNALYNTPIQPNYVSHLDCYHPNRAGQMKMAEVLWQAFNRTSTGVHALWYDEFENNDGCSQEFGAPWASCWYDYGDTGFDIKVDDQGWLKVEKDTGDQRRHFVERDVGDLSGMSAAWMSFIWVKFADSTP